MNTQELDILRSIIKHPFNNQRMLSERTGHSLGVVNKSLKHLIECGYLDKQARPTDLSDDLFQSHKPRNAVILAAGYGMRMVPINMSTPKAFLEVHGERLIERIIHQLHEVGIYDITVVVGFMKDHFEYLIDDYGIHLSYAPNYGITNNLHSLLTVSDKIDNTYIVPCDIWCENNPFDCYELYSWYMVSDTMDANSDIRINRKMELVRVGAKTSGNSMVGISYLTGVEASIVRKRLKEYSKQPDYNDQFWETTLYSNDRMIVHAKTVHASSVVEINTYEQLRDLDSKSNQLHSDALNTICKVLGCQEDEIVDIRTLKKGMTNRSFLFRVDKGNISNKYIMRIPGEGTDELIDRKAEAAVYRQIQGLGFCDDPIYINPSNGYKITKYIENVRCCDPWKEEDVRLCVNKLRSFHNYKVNGKCLSVEHIFDLKERIDFYESLWNGTPSVYRDYDSTKKNCLSLLQFTEKHRANLQLTHIDAVPDNFLFDPNSEGDLSLQLTDWEYAGMQDPHVDIAMFCIYSMYGKTQIDKLIDMYFEPDKGCSKAIRAKIYAYIAICGLLWSNWCEYKRNLGVEFGEYSLYQYRYSKEFYKYAVQLINELDEPRPAEKEN